MNINIVIFKDHEKNLHKSKQESTVINVITPFQQEEIQLIYDKTDNENKFILKTNTSLSTKIVK